MCSAHAVTMALTSTPRRPVYLLSPSKPGARANQKRVRAQETRGFVDQGGINQIDEATKNEGETVVRQGLSHTAAPFCTSRAGAQAQLATRKKQKILCDVIADAPAPPLPAMTRGQARPCQTMPSRTASSPKLQAMWPTYASRQSCACVEQKGEARPLGQERRLARAGGRNKPALSRHYKYTSRIPTLRRNLQEGSSSRSKMVQRSLIQAQHSMGLFACF